jgi:hypothetical protein
MFEFLSFHNGGNEDKNSLLGCKPYTLEIEVEDSFEMLVTVNQSTRRQLSTLKRNR